MKKRTFLSLVLWLTAVVAGFAQKVPTTLLYNEVLSEQHQPTDILLEKGIAARYTADGLQINGTTGRMRLNRYYSLGHRTVRYVTRFSSDAVVDFASDSRDLVLRVDVARKQLSFECNPRQWKAAPCLNGEDDFLVELEHDYATVTAYLTNLTTGESVRMRLTADGEGGSNGGSMGMGFYPGFARDYYCVSLAGGGSVLLKQMTVVAGACNLTLLIYGDSITEPESYYPAAEFPNAWTQQIMRHVRGGAMCSGRGGCTIRELLLRIPNELPYLHAKYVMVTIGTNGGNTEENLSQLVEYILKQGSIPILNNIPANESGTQVATNAVIEKVRQKYHLRGCRFDVATSVNRDGREVDKSMMWFENLVNTKVGKDIYHHPNSKGSTSMYLQTLIDIPEIYDGTGR